MNVVGSQRHTFLQLLAHCAATGGAIRICPNAFTRCYAAIAASAARDRRLYRELLYTACATCRGSRAGRTRNWWPWSPRCGGHPGHPGVSRRLCRRAAVCRSAAHGSPAGLVPGRVSGGIFPAAARCSPRPRPVVAAAATEEPAQVFAELATRGWTCQQSDLLPAAVKVLAEVDVTQTDSIAQGRVEVQDLGSQLLLEAVGIEPGGRWLDACAGAGGKTLQLVRLLGPGGQIDAHDIRAAALTELEERARRSPYSCSGGLDRRSEDSGGDRRRQALAGQVDRRYRSRRLAIANRRKALRFFTMACWSMRHAAVPAHGGARRTSNGHDRPREHRPGGGGSTDPARAIRRTGPPRRSVRLCDMLLCRRENAQVLAAFLAAHPDFAPAPFARSLGFTPTAGGLTILAGRRTTRTDFTSRRCAAAVEFFVATPGRTFQRIAAQVVPDNRISHSSSRSSKARFDLLLFLIRKNEIDI